MTRQTPEPLGPFAPLLAEMDARLGEDLPAAHHLGSQDAGGQLAETDVALLIGDAFRRVFSGCLTLTEATAGQGMIWFEAGLPIDVVVIDSAQAPAAARASATPDVVERWFFTLAAWTAGRFVWQSRVASPPAHRTHLLRHPAELVHEALRRRDTEPLRRWLGQETQRLWLRTDVASLALVETAVEDPAVRTALRLFDGGRSFADVAKASGHDAEVVLRAAFVLFCFGALEVQGDVAEPAVAGPGRQPAAAPKADRARLAALFVLAEQSDYFAFLGIDRTASRIEVAAATGRMARELAEPNLHPDVALATGRERGVILEVLSEARRILGDEGLRARYREALGPGPTMAAASGNLPAGKPEP